MKTPLRRAIVMDDFFFNTDEELLKFLKEIHDGDERKYFERIPAEKIEETRETKGNGLPIPGCRKARMISLFPDGRWHQIKQH